MDEQRLAEIDARLRAATPGPWGYKAGVFKHSAFSLDKQEDFGVSLQEVHWRDGHQVPAAANAQFIAAAPTDIADLLAEVRRLRGLLDDAAAVLNVYLPSDAAAGQEFLQSLLDGGAMMVRP